MDAAALLLPYMSAPGGSHWAVEDLMWDARGMVKRARTRKRRSASYVPRAAHQPAPVPLRGAPLAGGALRGDAGLAARAHVPVAAPQVASRTTAEDEGGVATDAELYDRRGEAPAQHDLEEECAPPAAKRTASTKPATRGRKPIGGKRPCQVRARAAQGLPAACTGNKWGTASLRERPLLTAARPTPAAALQVPGCSEQLDATKLRPYNIRYR
jgi:hypothetical protein